MKYKFIIFILIIINNTKYKYDSKFISFNIENNPIIYKLTAKSINNVFTLSFNLKILELVNNGYILSIGYYNLFFKALFIRQKLTDYEINLYENSNNSNLSLINNKYYYVILELEKIDIIGDSYKIKFKLNYGNNLESSLIEYITEQINIDFTKLIINLGSLSPDKKINLNMRFENLTIYNKKWNISEKNEIILGNIEPLIFIDFSNSLAYSQYYYNKINNNFFSVINGNSIYNDSFDLFHEFIKISSTQIQKKLLIFNNQQYILLPNEIIKYLENFDIKNYLVYFKINIHLNDNNSINNLDVNYRLYNRNNKSGIVLNLKKINENKIKLFEFNIKLAEYSSHNTIISNSQEFNFDYIILKYNLNNDLTLYNIDLSYRYNSNNYNINYVQTNNNFSQDDEHYIGDYDGVKINIGYILIELEEFMLGKGTYIKNISNDLIYDDIILFCSMISDNKINRSNLTNCNLRNQITTISSNCEYEENSVCLFKTYDVNNSITMNNSNINCDLILYIMNYYCLNSLSNCVSSTNEYTHLCSITCGRAGDFCNFYCNSSPSYNKCISDFNSVLDAPNAAVLNKLQSYLNTVFKINKPYRENIINNPKLCSNFYLSGNTNIDFIYHSNFIFGNNLIIDLEFEDLNITNNIFTIIFNNNEHSSIVINKNNSNKHFTIEIQNNISLNKPSLRIRNNTNNWEFKLKYIILVEVDISNITNKNKKFVGEPINGNYRIIPLKPYVSDESDISKLRNKKNLYITCNNNCDTCNGPTNKNCNICNNSYLDYYNQGCLLKNASNCLDYNNNPSFCRECNINNFYKIKIDNNNVLCFCETGCSCDYGYTLYNNENICKININNTCQNNYVLQPKNTISGVNFDKCLLCGNGCNRCNYLNINNCINCKLGYHLLNNTCFLCNMDGQFIDINDLDSNNQPKCKICDNSCKRCTSNSNLKCISCYNGKYLQKINSNSYKCTVCNDIGFYIENLNCNKCNNNCLGCLYKSINCISCKNGYLLDILKKDCILKCRDGTYQSNNNCLKCHNYCETCTNGDEQSCIICINTLYLNKNNNCVKCNNLNNIKIGNKCLDCNPECRSCNGIYNNNCLSCNNNLKLIEKNNSCSNQCPSKTYEIIINGLNYCRNCFNNCLSCTSYKENSCWSCDYNLLYNKYTKKCLKFCEIGYYQLNNNSCEKCSINCLNCDGNNNCLKCKNNYYLYSNNTCDICKNGYYISGERCLKCHLNCLTCINYNNCLTCNLLNFKYLDKKTNKYYCKLKCKNNNFFNKIENKCMDCNDCNNCQFKDYLICNKCLKCKNECLFNFKFNETGLYLFDEINNYIINTTVILNDNIDIINNTNKWGSNYYFEIIKNNDKLNWLNWSFSDLSVLKSTNCTKTSKNNLIIKKVYDKKCKIEDLNYDNINYRLTVKFNFEYLLEKISENIFFKITNKQEKYQLQENITTLSKKSLSFNFKPNYYKNNYDITIIFSENILKIKNCIFNNKIEKKFQINLKEKIKFSNDLDIKLKNINKVLNDNNKISKTIQNFKPILEKAKQYSFGIIIFSSLFSQFLGILIRFFQIVYIWDFISLLRLDLGVYTNSFLKFWNIDIKLYFKLNNMFNISDKNQDIIINKSLIINPKLKNAEFIYLTNINLEFLFCSSLMLIIILIKIFEFIIDYLIKIKFKNIDKNLKIQNIINNKNENKNIIIYEKIKKLFLIKHISNKIKIKFISLNITYIGVIFSHIVSSFILYSQFLYNFSIEAKYFKLFIILIIYYFLILFYIIEVYTAVKYQNTFKKQLTNYTYRENLFIFDTKFKGLHNNIILVSIFRDISVLIILWSFNIPTLYQIILLLLIQSIYLGFINLFRNEYDYKGILWFKIQETINTILIFLSLLIYFSKNEFLQFSFIILYYFLVCISFIDLFVKLFEIFILNIIYLSKLIYLNLKNCLNK